MSVASTERYEWLAQRMTGIGASDSPAILGLSPFKSEFQVWAEKSGEVEPEDLSDNEPVEFGIRLERPIAEAYADRTGRSVAMWPQFEIVRDPERKWFCCTPDATQHDDAKGEGLLQIKTTSAYKSAEWSDGPPEYYLVQLQHELAVTGFDWGTLVVLIGGQRLRYFDCERNDRFIAALIPRLEKFWRMVESGQPPPIDGSLATAKILARLHPDDDGSTVALPMECIEWAKKLQDAKAAIKAQKELEQEAENHLIAAIGDSTYGILPDGTRWSWKSQTRKAHSVKESTFRVLRQCK